MRGPRNRPQQSIDIIAQHLPKLEITTDCAASDPHGTGTPTTAFAEDKTPDDCRVDLLRVNLTFAEPLEEQPANDMNPLPPRCVRQTTDITHVAIERRQFTVELAPLLDCRNPLLGTKHMQQMLYSGAQLVAQPPNEVRTIARWRMGIQEPSPRRLIDQREIQALFGRPLRENARRKQNTLALCSDDIRLLEDGSTPLPRRLGRCSPASDGSRLQIDLTS